MQRISRKVRQDTHFLRECCNIIVFSAEGVVRDPAVEGKVFVAKE
jgi:hypothetical protein